MADVEIDDSEKTIIDLSTAVILPTNGYETYRDHYEYLSDEEYFSLRSTDVSHFNDTIFVELSDNNNKSLLSESDNADEYLSYNIAFRGNNKKSDFKLLDTLEISDDECSELIFVIREKNNAPNSVPPRPMASNTLLLDKMYKVDNQLFVVKLLSHIEVTRMVILATMLSLSSKTTRL